jgi:hypothetical protein
MRRRAGLACLVLAMSVAMAGCEEGDEAFVRDFLIDWAANNPGSTLGGLIGVGDGNEVTAALGALETIDKVNKADALMDEGRDKGDPGKMDEAIKLRPSDWTYRTSRAVLALDKGDLGGYDANVRAAQERSLDRTVNGRTVSGSDREVRQRYDELAQVEVRLGHELDSGSTVDGARCRKIYGEMAAMAFDLQEAARAAGDQLKFDQLGDSRRVYGDRQALCPRQ